MTSARSHNIGATNIKINHIIAMNIRNLKLKHITILNCSKENEILSCTLEKHVQDLQAENYNMLMSKIKEDINKWRDILCS